MADIEGDRYRKKYFDLLGEVDAKEKMWGEMDQRLRRILSHLLVVAQGPGTPEISEQLTLIREELKTGLDLTAVEERVAAIRDRVLGESPDRSPGAQFPPVHLILIHLVERLPLPPEVSEAALQVVESLEAGLGPEGLASAIEAVTGLVHRVRVSIQQEKRQLEALLKEVTGRLADLDKGLASAHRSVQANFAAGRSHDAAVREEVRGLEASTRGAEDLETLRAGVLATIESIRARMEAKQQEDGAREETLRQEIEELRHTTASLQGQVSEYQEKIRLARETSLRDPLTGCYNRLAYEERARAEEARWRRYHAPLSLIIFDLDHFKAINDSFGHRAGDEVLKTIAQIARQQLREVDVFARYGGEEFTALLPETPLPAALTVAEKVRRAVESYRFHSRGKRVPLTLSGGAAQIREGETVEATFERADKALYLAKMSGRNRCATEMDLLSEE
jgi:diguanylate cyclase